MDLTKRLGLPADLLKQATEVLEGKKISHPNQKAISTAAPPHDEITAADFKALKAKKKYKVEGVDRSGKAYESPLFETEDQAVALYNKIRKSAPISNLKIVEVTEKVDEVVEVSAPVEEAKELNKDNADDARSHDCAKHVVHEQWGVGETVTTMHADPDADGNIAWYDVMFEHGIEQNVPTSDLEITLSETHVHKKSKRMSEAAMSGDAGQGAKKDVKALKGKNKNVEINPVTKEEVEQADEAMDKSMAYATGTKQAMKMTGDKPPLEKSTIKKSHKIAKAIIRNEEVESVDEGIEASRKVAKMVGNAPSPHGDNPTYKPTKVPAELKNKPPTPVKPFKVKEEVELEEGRKSGVVGQVLNNPKAKEHFTKLTGKQASYFHITKNPDHAAAALKHAAGGGSEGESEKPESGEDTEANQHPINKLRGIADRGGGKFMGKDITRSHANKLLSMHDGLKPAQKQDFVSNIGKHLSNVMS